MTHITIAGWALLILGQVYLLKYRLFGQRIDKIARRCVSRWQPCSASAA